MNQRSQYFCYAKTALPSNFFSIHGEWFEKDITKVRAESLPDVDLWTGGFPCQDVSMAGERRGLYGERTGLFFEFIRLLREGGNHKPVSSTFATQKHPIQCRRYGTRSQNGFAKGKVLTKKMLRESFPLAEAGILPLFYVNWPGLRCGIRTCQFQRLWCSPKQRACVHYRRSYKSCRKDMRLLKATFAKQKH